MSEIESYAHQIAYCERLISEANEVYQEAKKQADTLKNRVKLLTVEHKKIVNERANGNETEENESRLVVLASDLNGLAPLVKKAEEDLLETQKPITLNRQSLQQAKDGLQIAEARAKHAALTEKSREIEALLVSVVSQVHQAGIESGSRHLLHNWMPSNEITRLVKDRVLP